MDAKRFITILLISNFISTNELPDELKSQLNSFEIAAFENLPESTKESILERFSSTSQSSIVSAIDSSSSNSKNRGYSAEHKP